MTYGDGVGDVDIRSLHPVRQEAGKPRDGHDRHPAGAAAGRWTWRRARRGALQGESLSEAGWINGGFFVIHPRRCRTSRPTRHVWEGAPLERAGGGGAAVRIPAPRLLATDGYAARQDVLEEHWDRRAPGAVEGLDGDDRGCWSSCTSSGQARPRHRPHGFQGKLAVALAAASGGGGAGIRAGAPDRADSLFERPGWPAAWRATSATSRIASVSRRSSGAPARAGVSSGGPVAGQGVVRGPGRDIRRQHDGDGHLLEAVRPAARGAGRGDRHQRQVLREPGIPVGVPRADELGGHDPYCASKGGGRARRRVVPAGLLADRRAAARDRDVPAAATSLAAETGRATDWCPDAVRAFRARERLRVRNPAPSGPGSTCSSRSSATRAGRAPVGPDDALELGAGTSARRRRRSCPSRMSSPRLCAWEERGTGSRRAPGPRSARPAPGSRRPASLLGWSRAWTSNAPCAGWSTGSRRNRGPPRRGNATSRSGEGRDIGPRRGADGDLSGRPASPPAGCARRRSPGLPGPRHVAAVQRFLYRDQLHRLEPFYPLRVYVCERCLLVQLPRLQKARAPSSATSTSTSPPTPSPGSSTAKLREHDDRAVSTSAPQAWWSRWPATTATCCSTSSGRNVPVLGHRALGERGQGGDRAAGHARRWCASSARRRPRELASQGKAADLIVGNNVLAHVPDLHDFVAGITTLLEARRGSSRGVPPPPAADEREPVRHHLPRALLLLLLLDRPAGVRARTG